MKPKIWLALVALLTTVSAFSQKKFYIDREAIASQQLKTTLQNARAQIAARNLKFRIGNTVVSETNNSELTGYKMPDAVTMKKYADYMKINSGKTYDFKLPQNLVNASALDLRKYHLVTPIRAQACGNCWTYGITCAMESNFLMNNHKDSYSDSDPASPANLNFSEAQALSCSNAGDCKGGWMSGVAYYYASTKTPISNEAENPDKGWNQGSCASLKKSTENYRVIDWGFIANTADNWAIPTVQQMKEAMVKHGAITAAFIAKNSEFDAFFKNYTDGVYDLPFPENLYSTNPAACIFHAITIVGWDDTKQAWLIKNSWGPGWGDQGYGWIGYNSSKIGIGATWVETKAQTNYTITPGLFKERTPLIFKEEIMDNSNPLLRQGMPNLRTRVQVVN